MESFGKRGQSGQPADGHEADPRRLDESSNCVAENSRRKAVGESCLGGRSARPDEKGVRIALGQELERAPADFGGDEDELGVQLPGLDVVGGLDRFLEALGRPRRSSTGSSRATLIGSKQPSV